MKTTLQFIIRSEFAEGREVQKRIMDEVERHHYGPDSLFAIKLSLEEALINAIKHGNKFDKDKTVRVEVMVDQDRAVIEIEDQGPGFRRASVPDPTAVENLERLHGRGILLMEAYMDEVQWLADGRRVRLVRENRSEHARGGLAV